MAYEETLKIVLDKLWKDPNFDYLHNCRLESTTVEDKKIYSIAELYKTAAAEQKDLEYTLYNGKLYNAPEEVLERAIMSIYVLIVTLDNIVTRAKADGRIFNNEFTMNHVDVVDFNYIWNGGKFAIVFDRPTRENAAYLLIAPVMPINIDGRYTDMNVNLYGYRTIKLSELTPAVMEDWVKHNIYYK